MKLKIKNLNWLAGRPVVLLDSSTAKKLNVRVNERISIPLKNKKIYAVVDIFSNLLKENEIGLSHEISVLLNKQNNSKIDVNPAQLSLAGQLIRKKLSGESLSEKEIRIVISDIVQNNLTEAELAFFVSAEKLNGMTEKETISLTKAMINTGKKLTFNKKIIADKHCIGGIAGNRTTPIVVSICAAAGLILPKTSSRAITSASGTADVIETIAEVEFSTEKIKKIVEKTNACLVWGGSLGLAPSDDKIIYVERLLNLDVEPQLLASIMSKKISAGSNHILIDIPYGKGAKIKTKKLAMDLGNKFQKISKNFNVKLKPIYTDGRQPIGNGIGPNLEMLDVVSVLQNNPHAPEDLKEKSLLLASELMKLCGIKNSKKKAKDILLSGKAFKKFVEIINTQNGKKPNSKDFFKKIKKLKKGKFQKTVYAEKSGLLKLISNSGVNHLCRALGTPENQKAGVFLHKTLGKIKKFEPVLTIYAESKSKLQDGITFLESNEVFKIK